MLYELGTRWSDISNHKRLEMAELAFASAENACHLATNWGEAWLIRIQLEILHRLSQDVA